MLRVLNSYDLWVGTFKQIWYAWIIIVQFMWNFRASGSVRRHCPLPFLLLPLSPVSSPVCSVVLFPSFYSASYPSPQASLSSLCLSLSLSVSLSLSLSVSLCLSPSLYLSLSLHCSVTSWTVCLLLAVPLMSPSCPFRVSHVLVMPLHFNSPFVSLSFSRYVRVILHVCPVLSLPVISRRLPSCRLVSLSFVSLSFPLHSPCFFISVPFMSPFISPCFPVMWTSYFLPSFPCTSFLHFPCAPQYFPEKKSKFSQRFRKETQSFPNFRQ